MTDRGHHRVVTSDALQADVARNVSASDVCSLGALLVPTTD